jgi:CBS domain-containing protein
MARYGSERIRGHGIPEAIEAILINGSRIQPRVAILKPISSAISIGSGGLFGAEGPIIMTGTEEPQPRGQHLFPLLDEHGSLIGVVTRNDVLTAVRSSLPDGHVVTISSII